MTLAMNEPSKNSLPASSLDLRSNTDSPILSLKNHQPEAASQIESPADFRQPESFTLVRENSHPNKPVTVRAGYGRIWDDQSTLQKIVCDHQETGCAYVCANFSF